MRSFIAAWRFLTIIPLPFLKQTREDDLARAPVYFPLIGAFIGLILLAFSLLFRNYFSSGVTNTLVVIVWLAVTGAMHLDGLADTFDGLGGKSVTERLEIMKDSRHGTFGVASIVCLLALKILALSQIHDIWLTGALIMAPSLGRWAMVLSLTLFPYARPSGLGSIFQREQKKITVLLIATLQILVLSFILPLWYGLVLVSILSVIALLIALILKNRFGGLTGDNYGAINEICEAFVLLVIILLSHNSV